MRNFTLVLFIFFIIFLIGTLFISDPLLFFITIFLGFLLCFLCLISYLGFGRGIIIGILFMGLPYMVEYFGFRFGLPYFETHLIQALSFDKINIPLTLTTLFSIFTIPLLFMASLFFSQKLKIFTSVKKYHKTFLLITASLLVAINFVIIRTELINFTEFIKWLIIALVINIVLVSYYKFKIKIPETFKELPIILYLAIYGSRALKTLDSFSLVVALILTFTYLMLLYKEHKLRQISSELRAGKES